MDEALAHTLARNWEDGWNRVDLATVMGDLADDVVFSSPFVSRFTGDAAQTAIEGYAAVEAYMANALERAGQVRYVLETTYVGTDSLPRTGVTSA